MSATHGVLVIEIRHLRALQAIARHGSLTAAAQVLHCSQSALSHLCADLERQLRLSILQREQRPPRLTAAGRRLLAAADAVLAQLAAAEDDLERLRRGTTGRLLISLECHSCFDWLVPTLDTYRAAHPDVELDLRVGASFDPLPALRDGVVDLVITSERSASPGVAAAPLFRYEIVAILPPGHALAAKPRLQPADFAAATIVTYPVDESRLDVFSRFLRPAGVAPAQRRTAELTAMIVQLVASGHGLAALPRWAIDQAVERGTVAARPLGRGGLWSDLYALRRSEQAAAPYLDAFIATARRVSFRDLAGIKPVPAR
jgi:LysR family transcriptional regulator for metE and metH